MDTFQKIETIFEDYGLAHIMKERLHINTDIFFSISAENHFVSAVAIGGKT